MLNKKKKEYIPHVPFKLKNKQIKTMYYVGIQTCFKFIKKSKGRIIKIRLPVRGTGESK